MDSPSLKGCCYGEDRALCLLSQSQRATLLTPLPPFCGQPQCEHLLKPQCSSGSCYPLAVLWPSSQPCSSQRVLPSLRSSPKCRNLSLRALSSPGSRRTHPPEWRSLDSFMLCLLLVEEGQGKGEVGSDPSLSQLIWFVTLYSLLSSLGFCCLIKNKTKQKHKKEIEKRKITGPRAKRYCF